MDLPLKLDIPKLSHLNILDLLCPFIPGVVVAVGLRSDSTSLLHSFNSMGFGYRTSVFVATVLVYIAGLAMMQLVVMISTLIHRLVKPQPKIPGGSNSYWRKLAAAYVGPELTPASDLSAEDIERYIAMSISGGLFSEDAFKPVKELRETIASYEKALESGGTALSKAKEAGIAVDSALPTAIAAIKDALEKRKPLIQTYDVSMRKIMADREWATLYSALGRLASTQNPLAAFGLLSTSIQTAAIGALCTMIHNGRSWGIVGTAFCIAVAISATYAGWLMFKLDWLSRFSGSSDVADLLGKLKNQPKVSEPNQN